MVAMRVGISKDFVTELATQFAERGLAGVGLGKKPEVEVTSSGPGSAPKNFAFPKARPSKT